MEKKRIVVQNHQGQDIEYGIAEYEDHVELLRYLTNCVESVDIPAEINGKPVTIIGADCFFVHKEIWNIIIPDSVNEIGAQAFAMCRSLKELIIPDSVGKIGSMAFRDCKQLHRCVLPANIEKLPDSLFSFCDLCEDADIVLPRNLKVVGRSFFRAGDFTLKIPDSVERIEYEAFYGFDGKVETKLPYDKGWYMPWPYGTMIIDSNGNEYRITDLREAKGLCCYISDVEIDGVVKQLFFPFDFEDRFHFSDEESQKRFAYIIEHLGKEEKAYYNGWRRGMV